MATATDILRHSKLRSTPNRSEILKLFLQQQTALSQPDIEDSLTIDCDRVTIYRTLSTFLDKGILHKVLDDTGVMKYALCSEECTPGHHHHDHIHFKCTQCGKTICIEQARLPQFELPEGYQIAEVNVLMQGTCAECHTD